MNKIWALCALLLLAACGDSRLSIFSQPITLNIAQPAAPAGVQMLPVHFRVVTADTLDSFMTEIRTQQGGATPVFIAISMRDYENMALNLADLRRYIEQQQAIIVYYRNVTTRPNN